MNIKKMALKSKMHQVLSSSNLILKEVNCPNNEEVNLIKDNTIIIGIMDQIKTKKN